MSLLSTGLALHHGVVRWISRSARCCSKKTNQRTVHRLLSSKTRTDGSQRNLQLAVAAGIIGFTGVTLYYCKGASDFKPEFADSVFQIPFVDGKSASTIYQYKSMWFPKELFGNKQSFQRLVEFPLRKDDILVVSFPKSGTTWLQKIVWHIVSDSVRSEANVKSTIEDLFPYLEYSYPGLKEIAQRPSPRLMKSHMPYDLLPADVQSGKGKVIYIVRNAKDVCVSYYHFCRMFSAIKFRGSFADFFHLFISGKVGYGPWQNHVINFWQHRNDENVLFLVYEDLHANPVESVRQIAQFLGRSLTDHQISKIVQLSSFSSMRTDPMVNYSWWDNLGLRQKGETQFLRKGVVGDWVNYFTDDMNRTIEECCIRRVTLQGLSLREKIDRPVNDETSSPPFRNEK